MLGLGVALWSLPAPGVRYVEVPIVVLPLPQAPPKASGSGPQPGPDIAAAPLVALAAPEPPAAEPVLSGVLDPCAKPCVALVVTGLGLASDPTVRALELPAAVGLSFSPYATDLAGWATRAAAAGHELLLDLPLQPVGYPEDDAGPLSLLVDSPPAEQQRDIDRVLHVTKGWLGVVATSGAFGEEPARFAPVAAALAQRKLALVELGPVRLREVAQERSLRHVAASGGGGQTVGSSLEAVEAEALRDGRALAVMPPTPVALAHLSAWLPTLPEKGLALVPLGTLLAIEPAHHEASSR